MNWSICRVMLMNVQVMRTEKVRGVLAVAEPSGGLLVGEIDAVGQEVGFHERKRQVVVVAHVHDRVPEHENRRHRMYLRAT